MFVAAHQYLGDTGMWDGIIANCYQEIWFTVAGALVHQRVANLTQQRRVGLAEREIKTNASGFT